MTPTFARFAIALSGSMEASIVLKATLVLGLTLAAVRLAPRARASIRHIVLAAAFCVLLTLPIVAVLLPPEDAQDAVRQVHGFLRGSVVIPRGTDLTAPTLDEPFDAAKGRLHR